MTVRPGGPRGRWVVLVDAINVFNRENAGLITCRVAGGDNSQFPRIERRPDFGLPLLPSVALRYRF